MISAAEPLEEDMEGNGFNSLWRAWEADVCFLFHTDSQCANHPPPPPNLNLMYFISLTKILFKP